MTLPHEPPATYHTGALLGLGIFGNQTPAGRRFHHRSLTALAVMVVTTILFAFSPPELRIWGWPCSGLCMAFISWEFWRYLAHIDELERRIQLEAIAWTYLVGIALAVTLGSLAIFLNWNVNPGLLIVLEPLRGFRLWSVAKRYQ